jgi:tetratricopeptide (TPR) repeat protein
MDPNYARGRFALGWAYLHKGDLARGVEQIEIARKLSGGTVEAEADLAYASARAGEREKSEAIREDLRQLSRRRYIDPYEFVRIETALGNHDAAFADLERAYALRSNLLLNLKVDPSLDPLRNDPRFYDLLVRMKLDE